MQTMKDIVIVGGGTAGWLAAAAIGKVYQGRVKVTLLESDAIGTVGVGEATIPTMMAFHKLLGISEAEMMRATNATFKLGINFKNWGELGEDYIHAFGQVGRIFWGGEFQHFWSRGKSLGVDAPFGAYCLEHEAARAGKFAVSENPMLNYAFHFDAGLYAKYLRNFSEPLGVVRKEGKVERVEQNADSGFITRLHLEDGSSLSGDFFIDCTGFRGLLIEETLKTGYENWQHWLPCDSALAVQSEKTGSATAYTSSTAHEFGWQWRIPLQNRTGNGVVYSSQFADREWAEKTLLKNIDGNLINNPRLIQFKTGRRKLGWNKNCIALGLASGFLEPLESTSIHMVTSALIRFLRLFPLHGIQSVLVDEYNRQSREEAESIRDFIILHYHATRRNDTDFWNYVRTMPVPDTLRHRIDMFVESGMIFLGGDELFRTNGWSQVLIGQGFEPKQYQPMVDNMNDDEFRAYLKGFRDHIANNLSRLPSHEEFIARYCAMN
ncbi:tryptophan halogenase family protein [Cellvibrio sp. NN19]|uniref:tryptophan halogenase family protein n=1 Tax=Cellvibrio chitinivorans TaxID=3102792 RepID=UPI002B409868|nr:tryptophan halogenase family protein [Cellvibrio sp. NN19]